MLTINTIGDFFSPHLTDTHRSLILRNLNTKIRLEDWLFRLNDKRKKHHTQRYFMPCPRCHKEGGFWVEPRDSSDIHPSQITKCLQKLWFDCSTYHDADSGMDFPYYLLGEEHIPPQLRMIFDLGHKAHEMFQAYGARGAWGEKNAYIPEFPIDPDARDANGHSILPLAEVNWIKGSVDAVLDPYIIQVPQLGTVAIRVIHEYKTINSNGYRALKQPKADHKWQATLYSRVLDIPVVVYVYLNKDNSQFTDFPVSFDPSLWNTINEKIDAVQHYVEEGHRLPWEKTSAIDNPRECEKHCPYFKICDPPIGKNRRSA